MSQIYKVVYNKDNEAKIIYVFASSLQKTGVEIINLNELFKENKDDELFTSVFTVDELKDIKKEDIAVKFVEDMIYADDTIETIKKKILLAITDEHAVSYEEVYLFCEEKKVLSNDVIYQELTNDGKEEITKEKLVQFIINTRYNDVDGIKDKKIYNYDDIIKLNLEGVETIIKKSIGQKCMVTAKEFIFVVNPYDVIELRYFEVKNQQI